MPTINDPVVIRFSNEQTRRAADMISRAVLAAGAIVSAAEAQGILQKVPDDPTYVLEDGAPADGRPPINGKQFHDVIRALQAIHDLLTTPDANGESHYTRVLQVAVNPTPRAGIDL